MKVWCFLLMLFCCVNSALGLSRDNFKYARFNNGLRVYIVYDAKAQYTFAGVMYNTGANNDPFGKSGFAHLFEHLMFRESKHYKSLSEEIAQFSSAANGTTSSERTNYYYVLSGENQIKKLHRAFKMERDRMTNLVLNKKNIALERDIVNRESNMRDGSNPDMLMMLEMRKMIMTNYPFGRPVGGIIQDNNELEASGNVDDMKAFYNRHYVPHNAIVMVYGGLDSKDVMQVVGSMFAGVLDQEYAKNKSKYQSYGNDCCYQVEPRSDVIVILHHALVGNGKLFIQIPHSSQKFLKGQHGVFDKNYAIAMESFFNGHGSNFYKCISNKRKDIGDVGFEYNDTHEKLSSDVVVVISANKMHREQDLTSLRSDVEQCMSDHNAILSDLDVERGKNAYMIRYLSSTFSPQDKAEFLWETLRVSNGNINQVLELDNINNIRTKSVNDRLKYLMSKKKVFGYLMKKEASK